jgi:ABC-2 type transport system ATP-binding protein
MPEERGLYPKMKVADQLIYLAQLHGVAKPDAAQQCTALLERLGLAERAGDAVGALSLGNQQRAQIAAALIHQPQLLILDEPFSGLDPMAVDEVMAVLREFAARGVPIFFSSHQLDVVERIADNLVILAGGEIKAAGPTVELQQAYAGQRYELCAPGDLEWVGQQPGISQLERFAGKVMFTADGAAAQAVLRAALDTGSVESFGRHLPTLAEVFREVIRDEQAENGKAVAA